MREDSEREMPGGPGTEGDSRLDAGEQGSQPVGNEPEAKAEVEAAAHAGAQQTMHAEAALPERGEAAPTGAEHGLGDGYERGLHERPLENLVEVGRLRVRKRRARRGRPRLVVDEARIREMAASGATINEISRACGVKPYRVRWVLAGRILRPPLGREEPEWVYEPEEPTKPLSPPGFRWPPYAEKAIQMRREGKTFDEIGEACGVSHDRARRTIQLAAPELKRPQGIETAEQAAKAVAMKRAGATFDEIGKELGLTGMAVGNSFRALKVPSPAFGRLTDAQLQRGETKKPGGPYYARPWAEKSARLLREAAHLQTGAFAFDVEKAVKLRKEGWDYVSISKAVGASRPPVMNAIKTFLLAEPVVRERVYKPKFDVQRAVDMINAGISYRKIAMTLGVTTAIIARNLEKMGHRSRQSLLPPVDMERVLELYKTGASSAEIGEKLGVASYRVYMAIRTWEKHNGPLPGGPRRRRRRRRKQHEEPGTSSLA